MTTTHAISNQDDMIDSRDVIARLAELDDQFAGYHEMDELARIECDDDRDEWDALKALADEGAEHAADWQCGEALIRDSHFADYARELAEDIGAIPDDVAWPMTCIDWDQAARELQQDYAAVDFDGVTYWVRG